MAFAVSHEVASPTARHFFFLEEDVGVGTGFDDVLRNGGNFGHFEQLLEGETTDGFTQTFAVLTFFHELATGWALSEGFSNAFAYVLLGMVGVSFLLELAINLGLTPAILTIIKAVKRYVKK